MQQFDDEENRFKDYPQFMDKPGTNEERSTIDEHSAAFEIKKEDIAIHPSEVARTYPINNQRYYLRENTSIGFIKLSTKSMSLANGKFELTRKLIVNGELVNEEPFSYKDNAGLTSGATINYPLPTLTLDSDVKIEFFAKRKAPVIQPGQEMDQSSYEEPRPGADQGDMYREFFTAADYLPIRIYALNFHTSKFSTFNEKVATATNPTFFHENEDNLEMKAIFRTSEPFEDFEKEFIVVKEIPLTTPWHLNNIDKCSGNILTLNQNAALPNQSISSIMRDLVCQVVIETETARPFIMFENGFLSIEFAENENIYNAINNLPGNSTKPTEGDYVVQFYYETPASTFTSPFILKTDIKTSDTKLNVAGQLSSGQSSRNELNKIDLNRTSGKFIIHYPGFAQTIARQEASELTLFNLLSIKKSKIQDKKY